MRVSRDLRHVVLISNKPCSCMNKGWGWNYQCKVTRDNGTCVSLKRQLKHMGTHINTMSVPVHAHTGTQWDPHSSSRHTHTYQSHCFSFSLTSPINKTTHNSLQHIIRIERGYFQLLYAFNWYLFSLQSPREKSLKSVQEPCLFLLERNKPRRYTAILWGKGRLSSNREIIKDRPA